MPRRYQVSERMLIARLEELEGRSMATTRRHRCSTTEQRALLVGAQRERSGVGLAVGAPAAMQTPAASQGTGMATRTEKKLSELVRERRATPSFSPSPVDEGDLGQIVRAGLEAPSGFNMQPWRFIVVREPGQRRHLRVAAMNQLKVEQAPVVIVACGDTEGWKNGDIEEVIRAGHEHGFDNETQIESMRKTVTNNLRSHPDIAMWVAKQTMIAATTMMWMAEALGYDTAPMEGFHEDQVREVLGIPRHVSVVCMLCIGHLQGSDKKYAGRMPPSRVAFSERYGQPLEIDR
jgi:nitroreductase